MSDSQSLSDRELRSSRTLTHSGEQQFEEQNERHQYKLRNVKRDIDSIVMEIEDNPVLDLLVASTFRRDLSRLIEKYEKLADDYDRFLEAYGTERSSLEKASFRVTTTAIRAKASAAIQQNPQPSIRSRSVMSANTSAISAKSRDELVQQTVKLETAKARFKYAKQEAELIQREAALKAERNVLDMKRELEEAESGLQAVEKALNFDLDLIESYELPRTAFPKVQAEDKVSKFAPYEIHMSNISLERTAEFIQDQRSKNVHHLFNENDCPSQDSSFRQEAHASLNPTVASFVPSQRNETQDFVKFLVKKDLIHSRLSSFDDQPTHYYSWKLSFKHILTELDATSMEQLDLLIKYLGPSSKKHAQNIRSANANYAATAVRLIWERLDSRFGSPEMIESSLHSRIVNFPKLTNNQRKELYELADLAAEIESIRKDERFYTTFAYFDSSLGVNRLVSKLPYNIQEKWTTAANNYKSTHRVMYPPFSFFASFVQKKATVRSDPGFLYELPESKPTLSKQTKEPFRTRNPSHVSSTKTDVAHNSTKLSSTPNSDTCPLHGTNHKLNNCRAFRQTPISERLDFIKKYGLCFKCCGPTKHMRSQCKENIKCSICASCDHPAALHVDREAKPSKKHEGEKLEENINTVCTKICNTATNTSKSCAKIVLAKVYHSNQPEYSKNIYCIIDDQSNRTLGKSNLFNFSG